MYRVLMSLKAIFALHLPLSKRKNVPIIDAIMPIAAINIGTSTPLKPSPAADAKCSARNNRADIRFIQISAHSCNVTDIVADIIGNAGRVTRIVLRYTDFDFAD